MYGLLLNHSELGASKVPIMGDMTCLLDDCERDGCFAGAADRELFPANQGSFVRLSMADMHDIVNASY